MRNNRQQKAVTPTSRGFGDSLLIQVRWKEEAHKKTSQNVINVFIMRSTVQCFLLCCLVGLQKREKEKVMVNVLFTKRRSIIAPKSHDNYPYILNVRHLR